MSKEQKKFARWKIALAVILLIVVLGGAFFVYQQSSPTTTPVAQRPWLIIGPEAGVGQLGNPPSHVTSVDQALYHQIYDTLVYYNQNMSLVPGLATSWQWISDDTWQFKLRQGVLFHDGTAFNATAVKVSLERAIDPNIATWATTYNASIKRVDIVDLYTVNIVTVGRVPYLPDLLTYGDLSMISPSNQLKWTEKELVRHPVGTGAFKFVEWVENQYVKMEANDNYWGGAPKIAGIIWKLIPDESARYLALQSGDIDVDWNPPTELVAQLKTDPNYYVYTSPALRVVGIWINSMKPPFDDLRVRQALFYSIDRPSIVNNILLNFGALTNAPLGHVGFGRVPVDYWGPQGMYPYDPQKATQLLHQAGWTQTDGQGFLVKDGKRLTIVVSTPQGRYLKDVDIATAIVKYLTNIGIDASLQVSDPASHFSRIVGGAVDMYILGWGYQPYPDPLYHGLFYAGTADHNTWSQWKNATWDALDDAALVEKSPETRTAMYAKLETMIMDAAIEDPIYTSFNILAAHAYVNGIVWLPDETPPAMIHVTVQKTSVSSSTQIIDVMIEKSNCIRKVLALPSIYA